MNNAPELSADRLRWNRKYQQSNPTDQPSSVLLELARFVPQSGTALDVAGGAGRHAVWLAERGLEVTLVDVSDVAIQLAERRSADAQVEVTSRCIDLCRDPFPAGPWDLVLCCLYLPTAVMADIIRELREKGLLIMIQPTVTNLQRHAKPPARYLLRPNQILELATGLELLYHREDWSSDGRHDAILVARKSSPSESTRHDSLS